MTLPVIADVFRVTLNWSHGGLTPTHNVMHLSSSTLDEDGLFTAIDDSVIANCWATVSDSGQVNSLDILKLDGVSAGKSYGTGDTDKWQGQEAGQAISNAPAIIKLATGLRGPRHRGRLYLPYTAEDIINNGILNNTTVALTTAAWDTFANDLITAGAAIGVASYKHADWNQAVNIACESAVGTMRRRQDAIRRSL